MTTPPEIITAAQELAVRGAPGAVTASAAALTSVPDERVERWPGPAEEPTPGGARGPIAARPGVHGVTLTPAEGNRWPVADEATCRTPKKARDTCTSARVHECTRGQVNPVTVNYQTDLTPQLANCRDYWLGWGASDRLDDSLSYYRSGLAEAQLIARLDGQAVGTALLYVAHGVAGVYVVTTLEAHRRQGIGAVLTATALKKAGARGVRIGTLQASGPGASVYARMGFTTVAAYRLLRIPAH
ncbi:GNAT family N-acetyltransferase [Streptomyces sp. NPDC086077]|uniref:GNAT family N-acetyltransferase n=1 Tax=Streptomyces sp. NPDC086077 TaxID=3154862 RepID=UPI0034492FC8